MKPCPGCGGLHGGNVMNIGGMQVELKEDNTHAFGVNNMMKWRVKCKCGVSGPRADLSTEAIAKWDSLPRQEETSE